MDIDLFYLSPNPFGGWVTYTAHLMDALAAAGYEPRLFKIGNRTERQARPFGYGEVYRNLSLEDALARRSPKLIVAGAKKFREQTEALYKAGAYLVVHDPTELRNLPDLNEGERCIVVRKVGLNYLPQATWIRHPYARRKAQPEPKMELAVSTARIDFDKHTDIILGANRLLPEDLKIGIYGFENRLYSKFKLLKEFPEWVQSVSHFSRDKDAAYLIMSRAFFSVDMSAIKGDGGGTQYTFLESWDAGCVPIINTAWERRDDDMVPGVNCLSVRTAMELAGRLKMFNQRIMDGDDGFWYKMRAAGSKQLKDNHLPATIGAQYKELIGG